MLACALWIWQITILLKIICDIWCLSFPWRLDFSLFRVKVLTSLSSSFRDFLAIIEVHCIDLHGCRGSWCVYTCADGRTCSCGARASLQICFSWATRCTYEVSWRLFPQLEYHSFSLSLTGISNLWSFLIHSSVSCLRSLFQFHLDMLLTVSRIPLKRKSVIIFLVKSYWRVALLLSLQGEMGANVLVALQIAREDEQEFIDRAHALGYEFQDECNNEAFQLILRWSVYFYFYSFLSCTSMYMYTSVSLPLHLKDVAISQ